MSGKAKAVTKNSETRREHPSCKTLGQYPARSGYDPTTQFLALQRSIGNQAVQGLLESGMVQPKLKIRKPGDKYEKEADRMAEQVMRMTVGSRQKEVGRNENIIQKEEKEEIIQTKPLVAQITPLVQRQNEEEDKQLILFE